MRSYQDMVYSTAVRLLASDAEAQAVHRARQKLEDCDLVIVVLDASLEVRSAVVHASVIIVLVFVPVFFLPGLAGTFCADPVRSATVANRSMLEIVWSLSLPAFTTDGQRTTNGTR